MMKQRVLCWVLGSALLAAPKGWVDAKPVRILRDLPYKTEGSPYEMAKCKLDLHLPMDEDNFPIVIWLHGGSLKHGAKDAAIEQKVAARLTKSGVGCASIDYRLSPRAKFPAAAEDVAAAVAWVHGRIAKHGGDPGAIFLGGHSAGGFLAAIVSSDAKYLEVHDLSPSELCGVIPISGQMATHTTILEERGMGSDPRVVDEAAPLFHVNSPTPPQLVIVGGSDLPGREDVNREYVAALQKTGRTNVTLLVVPKRDHQSIVNQIHQPNDEVARAILQFVTQPQVLKLTKAEIGDIKPLSRFGNIYLGGQPTQEDLEELSKQGFQTIINLRKPNEIAWSEADQAAQLKLEYIALPFQSASELTDELFDSALQTLRNRQQEKTLLHCGSSVRVGAIWYAYRRLEQGVSPELALQEAIIVGLRSPNLLEVAENYVEQRESSKSEVPSSDSAR